MVRFVEYFCFLYLHGEILLCEWGKTPLNLRNRSGIRNVDQHEHSEIPLHNSLADILDIDFGFIKNLGNLVNDACLVLPNNGNNRFHIRAFQNLCPNVFKPVSQILWRHAQILISFPFPVYVECLCLPSGTANFAALWGQAVFFRTGGGFFPAPFGALPL
jgi:hypothetical protein